MQYASFIHLRHSFAVLIAAVLLCGCERGLAPSEPTREQRSASSESEPTQASTQADSAFIEGREQEARIARVSADLAAARALQTELQQQRAEIDARLVAHQEQGMTLLDSMRSQVQEQTREGRDEATLKADVRAKLEAALAEDDALTASLREIDARLAETTAEIERLNAERKTLQEGV